ncbi:hypothetical protein [Nostoc sp.]
MATRPARRTLLLEQSYYVRLAEQYYFFIFIFAPFAIAWSQMGI